MKTLKTLTILIALSTVAPAWCAENPALDRGLRQMELDEYDKAVQSFGEAIKADPNDARSYSNRGRCLYEMNDLPGAVKDFSFVIEHSEKKDPQLLLLRGTAFSRQGKHAEAVEDYAAAMKLKPELVVAEEEEIPKMVTAPPAKSKGAVTDYMAALKKHSEK